MACNAWDTDTTTRVEAVSSKEAVRQDIEALRTVLFKEEEMIVEVKLNQRAVDASMQALDDHIQLTRRALDELVTNFQASMEVHKDVKEPEVSLIQVQEKPVETPGYAPDSTQDVRKVSSDKSRQSPKSDQGNLEEQDHEEPVTMAQKLKLDESRNKIVIPPLQAGIWAFIQAWCRKLVLDANFSSWFEIVIAGVIIVNSIVIGVETQLSLSSDTSSWARPVEIAFVTIYTIEICIRLVAKGLRNFQDGWFLFDLLLVALTMFSIIISGVSESWAEEMQQVLVFRAVRLLRLLRTFRMIRGLRTSWRLVYGLITSGETMISTLMLLFLVLYTFAVLGVEAIRKDPDLQEDPRTNAILEENFSSIYVTMVTLSQFVTMDSIAAIYLPLVKKKIELGLYFVLLVIIVSISLMNLVTAVIVEGALDHARKDREEENKMQTAKAKNMLSEIEDLFQTLDKDQNKIIRLDEIERAERDPKMEVYSHVFDKASVESLTELFKRLDLDESGELTRDEFTEGLLNILLLDIPVSDLQVLKMMRLMRSSVKKLDKDLNDLKRVFSRERGF